MTRALARPGSGLSGKCAALAATGLLLAACPTPLPTCGEWGYDKPGIAVRDLMPDDKDLSDDLVVAHGQIDVVGGDQWGAVSLRLVSYENPRTPAAEPYGEKSIWLDLDGRFSWVLPAGRYVIQPLYFNHAYDARKQAYTERAVLQTSLEFELPAGTGTVDLGITQIAVSSDHELQTITITNEENSGSISPPPSNPEQQHPVSGISMIENPELAWLAVRPRKHCKSWGNYCFMFPVPYGGCAMPRPG